MVANDIIEVVSELGNVISDQLSPIVASGHSGSGILTAGLQVQGGANVLGRELGNDTIELQPEIEYCVDVPPLLPIPADGRGKTFVQLESFEPSTFSVNNDSVGGVVNDHGVLRLAIENDAQLSTIPSGFSSLSDFQNLPNETFAPLRL